MMLGASVHFTSWPLSSSLGGTVSTADMSKGMVTSDLPRHTQRLHVHECTAAGDVVFVSVEDCAEERLKRQRLGLKRR